MYKKLDAIKEKKKFNPPYGLSFVSLNKIKPASKNGRERKILVWNKINSCHQAIWEEERKIKQRKVRMTVL